MKEQYRRLLRKTYELEGLLLLALEKDEIPEDLMELISFKRREIAEERRNNWKDRRDQRRNGRKPWQKENQQHSTEKEESGMGKETDIITEKPAPQVSEQEEPAVSYEPFYAIEDDDDEVIVKKPENHEKRKHLRKKPVFSLNDRFLYMRELFDGDAAEFNAALNKLASFENFNTAQTYLVRECRLNPEESETAANFFDIIEKYYKE